MDELSHEIKQVDKDKIEAGDELDFKITQLPLAVSFIKISNQKYDK